mmetsp:Transcript_5730/g.11727  ORF Transcript_5730/g.11727 Transcript_5730/m.11727 type:complete len:328 (-) Transcript_5730:1662-2645(-)
MTVMQKSTTSLRTMSGDSNSYRSLMCLWRSVKRYLATNHANLYMSFSPFVELNMSSLLSISCATDVSPMAEALMLLVLAQTEDRLPHPRLCSHQELRSRGLVLDLECLLAVPARLVVVEPQIPWHVRALRRTVTVVTIRSLMDPALLRRSMEGLLRATERLISNRNTHSNNIHSTILNITRNNTNSPLQEAGLWEDRVLGDHSTQAITVAVVWAAMVARLDLAECHVVIPGLNLSILRRCAPKLSVYLRNRILKGGQDNLTSSSSNSSIPTTASNRLISNRPTSHNSSTRCSIINNNSNSAVLQIDKSLLSLLKFGTMHANARTRTV